MSLYVTGVVLKEALQIICFSSSWGCRRSKPIFKNASLWQESLKLKQEASTKNPIKGLEVISSRRKTPCPSELRDRGKRCPKETTLATLAPAWPWCCPQAPRVQCGKLGLSHCPESPAGVTVHRKRPPAGGHWMVSSATSRSGRGPRSGCKQ